jgi:hypothetical protein
VFNRDSCIARLADSVPRILGQAQKTRQLAIPLEEISVALASRDAKLAVGGELTKGNLLLDFQERNQHTAAFENGHAQNNP